MGSPPSPTPSPSKPPPRAKSAASPLPPFSTSPSTDGCHGGGRDDEGHSYGHRELGSGAGRPPVAREMMKVSVMSRSGREVVKCGIQLNDEAKVADLQEAIHTKIRLAESASSELRSFAWADDVCNFMRSAKRQCIQNTGTPVDSDAIREAHDFWESMQRNGNILPQCGST